MSEINKVLAKEVLNYLSEVAGTKVSLKELALAFKMPQPKMRAIADSIRESEKVGTQAHRFYTVLSVAQVELINFKSNRPLKTHAKPYVMPQSMIDARTRAQELYPAGRGFITIA